jgi:3alpha(or 20beta)-hydroxysteroid dehydrogenase
MSYDYAGRTVLVTGGTRGIGAGIATAFLAAGADVVICARHEPVKVPAAGGREAFFFAADVRDPAEVDRLITTAAARTGRLDVLVNNAGVLKFATIADMPLADFRRILDVNAVGCWLGMKAVIGPMTAAGGGSIINISSVEGFTGAAGLSAYSASKFAIRGMTKAAAQELGQLGIRVNSVHPGGVLTSMVLAAAGSRSASETDDGSSFIKAMPLARFAEPAEISRLVAFLASDEASYSTGSEFVADGGILSGPGY